jgi:hypothetical protein
MRKTRLNVYMTPAVKKRIEAVSEKLGKAQTEVASLAIEAGLDLLELSISEKFALLVARNPEFIEELQGIAHQAQLSVGEGRGSDEHSMDGRQDNP